MVVKFPSNLEVCNCHSDNIYDETCSAIFFNEVADVVLKGINVTVHTPNISSIVFWAVSNITIQYTTVYSHPSSTCAFGILVSKAENVQVSSFSACQFNIGIYLIDGSNISITLATSIYNNQHGMFLLNAHNISIINATTTRNGRAGIILYKTSYSFLNNTTAIHNKKDGIYLKHTRNIVISNTITTHNGRIGLFLSDANNTCIINITAMYNYHGMHMYSLYETVILNIELWRNIWNGINLYASNNTHIVNASAMYNGWHGLSMANASNTKINNIITGHNNEDGTIIKLTTNTTLINVLAMNNIGNGIDLQLVRNTWLTNITAINNTLTGIEILHMENSQIINVTASLNNFGIYLNLSNNTNLNSISVTWNNLDGVALFTANNSNITALTASHNTGNGIGMSFSKNVIITEANIIDNVGRVVFAESYSLKFGYFFQLNVQISIWSSTETVIQNSSFVNINPPRHVRTTNPRSQPVIIALFQSTLEISDCSFKQNQISSVKAHGSNITLSGNVLFSNNTAASGTAFILVQGSIISLVKTSNVLFENNFATNTGGVFYIGVNDYVYLGDTFSHRDCFLNTPVDRSQIQFIFENNSAAIGGDILYGGQVEFSFDGDWNCLESFKNISTLKFYQTNISLISSDPSRVCFCNGNGLPDCTTPSHSTTHSLYPGQNILISAVTVGQNFGTVAGSVYAQYLKKSLTENLLKLEHSQNVQSVAKHSCNLLNYTIYCPYNMSEIILILTSKKTILSIYNIRVILSKHVETLLQQFYQTSRIESIIYSNAPVYANISILPCPAGFTLTNRPPFKCDCNQLLQQIPGVQCNINDQTIGRSGLVWVGMTEGGNGTHGTLTVSKHCQLNYCNRKDINVILTMPDSQCNYNHSGILCGACQHGLSLVLGSERCLPCSNKYLTLFIPLTLAGPVLVAFIKFLDLTVSQGTIDGLIFYVNIIQANHNIFVPGRSNNILSLFIAWLNLDLGVETCFFNGLNAYYKTWLQFVFPLYISCIAGLIIIFSKFNNTVRKVMENNSIPVLATMLLLLYAKLFRTIITALSYTVLYTSEGHKVMWSADGNVKYLGSKHTFLLVLAIVILFFLYVPYTLILFLGHWLQMYQNQLFVRILFKIKPFLDSHYTPLKGKHRYWFGFLHLVRAAILLVSSLIPADHSSVVIISILASAVVLSFVGSIVYQNIVVSLLNVGFYLNLILISGASLYTQFVGDDSTTYTYALIGLAFLQFVGLIIFNVVSILRKRPKVIAYFDVCMKKHDRDDWELFEQAALLRERKSESEEEGSDSSGSMESLPTY